MKIVVASSKNWFHLNEATKRAHEILILNKKDDLSLEALYKFNPDLIFSSLELDCGRRNTF